MKALIKSSLKLLIRTKIIWLFIVIMPVLSTVILKSNSEYTAYMDELSRLVELDSADEKVAYNAEKGDYVVKIYDASKSEMSEYLIDRLAESGMFILCRADISGEEITDDYIKDHIEFDGNEDRMGAALYIPADFSDKVMDGKISEALIMYVLVFIDTSIGGFKNQINLGLFNAIFITAYTCLLMGFSIENWPDQIRDMPIHFCGHIG